jgi:NADPH:quinone reductase-like Zn-dependent oxidoreductase
MAEPEKTFGDPGRPTGLMTAAIFDAYGPPEVIRLAAVTKPMAGVGEVLIRTRFVAVNAIDCMTRAGRGVSVERFPGVLGWDVAGFVVAVGPGVSELKEGDEVFGMPRFPQHVGCCAQYVVSPAAALARIPGGVSAREAGAVPMVALTACQALREWPESFGGVKVLVHGASGGVGHLAVQIAKHAGAHVLATASARNHSFLAGLGADEVHDYAQSPFEGAIHDVDVALDTRGGGDVARLVQITRPRGMVISLKGSADQIAQTAAAAKDVQLRSIMVRPDRAMLLRIGEWLRDRSIRVEIETELPLARIAQAHGAVETGHARGRIVLNCA